MENTQYHQWLENLKPEDVVIFQDRDRRGIAKVARVTPTQIVLSNERKYNKKNGGNVGDSEWNFSTLEFPEPEKLLEIRTSIKKTNLLGKIALKLKTVTSVEVLEKIHNILNEA